MSARAIAPRYRSVSGSTLIDALAKSLSAIKDEDGLTDKELAQFVGKSGQDSGKAYRTGFAEMPVTSFLRGCERWNGRFANEALALIGMKLVPVDPQPQCDRTFSVIISRLKLAIDEALENDGVIDPVELDAMQSALDDAARAIDARRTRVTPIRGAGR